MKNNKLAIATILLLTSIAFWLINKDKETRTNRKDFAIENIDRISKIVIKNKTPMEAVLERAEKGWTVNGKHPARQAHIDVLLNTLKRMEARNAVPVAARENVYKNMITSGTEVNVYDGNEMIKTIYIGGQPTDQIGTYMMLKNSTTAHVVYIPGFQGFLSTRFFANELDWRNHNIYSVDNIDLAAVEINYPENKKNSFRIEQTDQIILKDEKGNVVPANEMAVQQYVSFFRNVNFEAFLNGKLLVNIDSIRNSTPLFELSVTDKKGNVKEMKAFRKKAQAGTTNSDGSPQIYDKERMYASIEDDFVLIQHYTFNKITKHLSDLKK